MRIKDVETDKKQVNTGETVEIVFKIEYEADYPYDYPYDYAISVKKELNYGSITSMGNVQRPEGQCHLQ